LSSLPYFDRLDYVSMLVQEHAYCLAIESCNFKENHSYSNIKLRTVFDELTRVLNHLLALSCHALDVGSMSSLFWAFEEREHIMEFYERLSGARMHAAFYRPFDYYPRVSTSFYNDILFFIRRAKKSLNEIHNVLTYNRVWKQRLVNIGIITKDDCRSYSITGVLARSSGCKVDLRMLRRTNYGCYLNLRFKTFLGYKGDCYDRYLLRLSEIIESFSIINQCILFDISRINNNLLIQESEPVSYSTAGEFDREQLKIKSSKFSRFKRFIYSGKSGHEKSYDFIKMAKVLSHFKSWASGTILEPSIIYRSVESPKGEFGVQLITNGGSSKIFRAKIRSSSYHHLSILSKVAKGHYLTDLVTLIGSIDIVFGEIDR